jgi:rod shape-determining protein MreD
MFKQALLIIIFFYFLILLQTSFLIHFSIFLGKIINYIIILITLILINFFVFQKQLYNFIAAFSAGFFLDIFSGQLIGTSILIFILIIFFINFLKKHINLPSYYGQIS